MTTLRCMCGDTDCPSCGTAQGTLTSALERDLEVCHGATKGPWETDNCESTFVETAHHVIADCAHEENACGELIYTKQETRNAAFIARARTRWPKALAVVKAVKEMYDDSSTYLLLTPRVRDALRALENDDHA